jgi:ABC-type glycerol-3-phosphate transport system permease component
MTPRRTRCRWSPREIATYAVLLLAIFTWSIPVLWVVITSIKPRNLIFTRPPTLFFIPTLDHYIEALDTGLIIQSIGNSLVISVLSTALAMLIATPAAYAFARLRFRMRGPLTFYTLLMQMAPPMGLLIPFYFALSKLSLLDTFSGLVSIYLTITIPFSVWLMMTYFAEIPVELEEAAVVDGASHFTAFLRIIMPLARGGIAVTTIFAFINAWNDFLFAVVLSGPNTQPATVAIFGFLAAEESRWGPFTATGVLIMMPVVFIALLAQRHIVHGLSLGGIKG